MHKNDIGSLFLQGLALVVVLGVLIEFAFLLVSGDFKPQATPLLQPNPACIVTATTSAPAR